MKTTNNQAVRLMDAQPDTNRKTAPLPSLPHSSGALGVITQGPNADPCAVCNALTAKRHRACHEGDWNAYTGAGRAHDRHWEEVHRHGR